MLIREGQIRGREEGRKDWTDTKQGRREEKTRKGTIRENWGYGEKSDRYRRGGGKRDCEWVDRLGRGLERGRKDACGDKPLVG